MIDYIIECFVRVSISEPIVRGLTRIKMLTMSTLSSSSPSFKFLTGIVLSQNRPSPAALVVSRVLYL